MVDKTDKHIIIIGGGIIGLATGWQLAKAGCRVEIFERDLAGQAASWAAAGIQRWWHPHQRRVLGELHRDGHRAQGAPSR